MTPATDLKLIAFYLPQFHPIPENDLWWGKGFTEWTNVTRARPLFKGHYQPHLPADLGFYDLRVPEVRRQQVSLAQEHGIYGFCFYYYWFGGRRILERPLNDYLADTALDFPFCVCWANENWTRRWDGSANEMLLEQTYSDADDTALLRDLLPLFRDPRYIRVGGAPLLLIYRADELPNAKNTARTWRQVAAQNGIPALHLSAVESSPIGHPADFGFDSAVEFPPHCIQAKDRAAVVQKECPEFTGTVKDYREAAQSMIRRPVPPYRLFRGVCTSWDNSPRTGQRGTILTHSSPREYELWLHAAAEYTCQHQPPGERLLFVNAWNEWAEGAYLEPDRRHGRNFLRATRRVVEGHCNWRTLLNTLKEARGLPAQRTADLLNELRLILEGRDRAVAYLLGQVASTTALTPRRLVTFLEQAMVPSYRMPDHIAGQVCLDTIARRRPDGGTVLLSRGKPVLFQGWAFVEGRAIYRDSSLIFLLVNRGTGTRFFAHVPQRCQRPDVCSAYPQIDAACTRWSGFDFLAELDRVPAGIYDAGVVQPREETRSTADLLPASEGSVVAFFRITLEVPTADPSARAA